MPAHEDKMIVAHARSKRWPAKPACGGRGVAARRAPALYHAQTADEFVDTCNVVGAEACLRCVDILSGTRKVRRG